MSKPKPSLMADRPVLRWGVLWRSDNALDGRSEYLMWQGTQPHLFNTRREARAWTSKHYSYIRTRPDLRREPHGWRMPKAVRVRVKLEVVRG